MQPSPTRILFIDGNHPRRGGIESLNQNLPGHLKGIDHARTTLSKAFVLSAKSTKDLLLIFDLAITWKRLPFLVLLKTFGILRNLLFRTRSMVVVREHHYSAAFVKHNVRHRRRFKALLKLAYLAADRVVPVSKGQAQWLQQEGLCQACKLFPIRHVSKIDDLLMLGLPVDGGTITYGAFGRWTSQKGFDELIIAWTEFSSLNNMHLLISGSGPDHLRLSRAAENLPNVSILDESDPISVLARCHYLIIPSRWEPYGLVCLEARAAGRPVLVSDVDGLPEQIVEPACGLSYKSGDIADLRRKIRCLQTIIEKEPEVFFKWSQHARQAALQRREHYTADLEHLFQRLFV